MFFSLKKVICKYRNTPVQAKASLWYTVCNILQKGISFLVVPIYIRLLTTVEYGKYSVFQSWKEILIIFITLNLYCGVFTKAMVDYENDRDKYTSCMQGLTTVLVGCWLIIYAALSKFWNHFFEMDTATMLMLFAYFVFFSSFSFWSVRQRVEYKYVKMVIVTLLVSVAIPLTSVFLLYNTELKEKAVIWGYLLIQSGVGLIFYVIQFYQGKVFYIKKYWVSAIKFNIPLIPHYLSLIVLGQADRIMIQKISGSEKAGIYTLAYQVSLVLTVLTNAINGALVPWIYEKLKRKEYSALKNAPTAICVLLTFLTMGVILVAPEFIMVIGTSTYKGAMWIVPSVAISVYFTFCYELFSAIEFYFGKTKFVMVASMIGAALNIILNAIFIPVFGYIAAGYTTLICYLVFMIMHYLFMRYICNTRLNREKLYNIPYIVTSVLALCVFGAVCMVFYDRFVVRYTIVAMGAILVIVFRKKIISSLRELK